MNSNVGWVFDASIHVTHYKLLGKHLWEKTTFVYRICNSGFKKISKETIKKLDKEFKSTKNSYFANPLSCHMKPIHVQPSTFRCIGLWTLHSKSSEIFMNPCNFLPLECCWKLATIFPPLETPGLIFPHLSSVHKSEGRKCAFSGMN